MSASAMENRLMLGQVKVNEKSNEITAIPLLLESLEIKDCTITIDAMGTQKEIAKNIVEKDADYVLSLKRNHPTLHDEVESWFEKAAYGYRYSESGNKQKDSLRQKTRLAYMNFQYMLQVLASALSH